MKTGVEEYAFRKFREENRQVRHSKLIKEGRESEIDHSNYIRNDPFKGYMFRIEIDGMEMFGFKEVSGLSNKTDIYEYQEGGENKYTRKFSGQTTFSNLILKNGIVLDPWVYEWRQLVIDGKMAEALKTISIVLEGGKSSEDRIWRFYDVWPCKWESNKFDAMSDDLGIETLELALSMGEEAQK
jgi:phage tail-like protein